MSSGGHHVWLCSPFPGRHPRSIKTEEGPFPSRSYGGHPFTLRQPGGHVTLPQVRWGWGRPSPEPLPPQPSLLFSGLADPVPSAPPAEAAGNSQWPLLQVGAGAVSAALASLVLAPGTLPHTALHTPCPLDCCLCRRLSPAPGNSVAGQAGWRAWGLRSLQGHLIPAFIPQSEQSDLDFFSSKPGPGACSPADGPLLQPSVAPAGSPQAPVVPAGVPALKASPFLFSTGLAPAPAPKAKPITPGYHGSALGDSTLHQLDVLDQLLQEAKV